MEMHVCFLVILEINLMNSYEKANVNKFYFDLKNQDNNARYGEIKTAWGNIDTPAFMPVGTAATVKAMLPESIKSTGAQIILANTYHLMLRPGEKIINKYSGVRNMMGWDGPLLTDSGGYQVMSLSSLRELNNNGVKFRSHLDGSEYILTPEISTNLQRTFDATISMVLDECTKFPSSFEEAEASMYLSMDWAERSKKAFKEKNGYAQFGIVQGSIYKNLREISAEILKNLNFDGYAVGGLAVGEGQNLMFDVLDFTCPILPKEKPRYLMGVGKPSDIVGAVARGIDMFDCVLPTRSGRTGQAFTKRGTINLRNSRHAGDKRPVDDDCKCPACIKFSRGYLHHLFKCDEILGSMLLTWHNLQYYQNLMLQIRKSIKGKFFENFLENFILNQDKGDVPEI